MSTSEDLQADIDVSKALSEAEKAAHEAKLAELEVRKLEFELLETQLGMDYQLSGEYAFFKQVNQKSARSLIRTMRVWHKYNPHGPWVIYLNSVGGEIQYGAALFDEIAAHSVRGGGTHHVTIRVRGLAASMAGILLQAADERVIGSSSQIMIHESQGGVYGSHSAIEQEAVWHRRWRDYMVQVFLSRTDKISADQLVRRIQHGKLWYLHADEALRLGFVDRIG